MADFIESPQQGALRMASGAVALVTHMNGNGTQAWEHLARMLPDGPATGLENAPVLHGMLALRVAARIALDTGAEACPWLEAHDRWLAATGAVLGRSEGEALWGEYYRRAGESKRAREHAERALALASAPQQPVALLAAHRLLGELDTDARQYEDAERHLKESLSLADACRAPYERALTLVARAERHAAMHQPDDAVRLLDEARRICERLVAKPTLARIATLAEYLSFLKSEASPAYPAGLTEREAEVLRLVAAGLSNAEIAKRLFVSPRTVNGHLTNIYGKLGVTSRSAAVRFAFEHRLTGQ